jgi:hypothetical protein
MGQGMELFITFVHTLGVTVKDVLPVLALLVFFQLVVLRRPIPNLKRVVAGFVFVLVGLALFLDGLEMALFPIGKIMAKQLSAPEFVFGSKTAHRGTLVCVRMGISLWRSHRVCHDSCGAGPDRRKL